MMTDVSRAKANLQRQHGILHRRLPSFQICAQRPLSGIGPKVSTRTPAKASHLLSTSWQSCNRLARSEEDDALARRGDAAKAFVTGLPRSGLEHIVTALLDFADAVGTSGQCMTPGFTYRRSTRTSRISKRHPPLDARARYTRPRGAARDVFSARLLTLARARLAAPGSRAPRRSAGAGSGCWVPLLLYIAIRLWHVADMMVTAAL